MLTAFVVRRSSASVVALVAALAATFVATFVAVLVVRQCLSIINDARLWALLILALAMESHCLIALVSRHSAHRIATHSLEFIRSRSWASRAEFWPLIDLATVRFHGLLLMSY